MGQSWTRRDFIHSVSLATASLAVGRSPCRSEYAPVINKRQALLDLLDPNKKQEYIPAGFFLHFDEAYYRGPTAIEKHLEFFRSTGMDFVKIQYENRFPSILEIKTPSDWARMPLYGEDFYEPHLKAAEDGDRSLVLDGLYYVTAEKRYELPVSLAAGEAPVEIVSNGRVVRVSLERDGDDFLFTMRAEPADGIVRWGFGISATADEYFTGLMERVVDGHQKVSWSPLTREAMNLRGQRVEMIVKPTLSVYAPFYLSSRGYATFVEGTWPGVYDFCADDPQRVKISFEGPFFEMRISTAEHPLDLVRAHAMEVGPPFLPPRWAYRPWRWRDEHVHLETYYGGTPVTGPFNSQVMEDVLMMRALGIPSGVYWIDRPWGPGRLGYDDFEIDPQRLPHFVESVEWLAEQGTRMFLWIAPFLQGEMEREGLSSGYALPGQPPQENNYPAVDLTNPEARAFWQAGIAKVLDLGVSGFKLDRGEEGMPESREFQAADGRSIREVRNAYPALAVRAVYEVARKHRGDGFVVMPRGAYTGSSPYGAFWGGDIGGTQEGLRASIIAIQRAAVMGYPNWGADTCGYKNDVGIEQEVCGRWLGFVAFNPIMEVGPTRNVAFWSLPRTPSYDPVLIAIWRLYARLHDRLADYSYAQAKRAAEDGNPIVRPLFLADPEAAAAWSNWWTFLYGPDLLVSPIWEKGKRTQEVYLPAGDDWRNAWRPEEVHKGGQTIQVAAELHQIPLFVRVGAGVEIGDLNAGWNQSLEIAHTPPDLEALDAEVAEWFSGRAD